MYKRQFIGVQVHIKMPLLTDVRLGPGDIVLHGNQVPPIRGTAAHPQFWPVSILEKRSAISATAEYLSYNFRHFSCMTASNLIKITETPQGRRMMFVIARIDGFHFLFESVQ